jgi:chemotaxis protein CheD
MEPKKTVSVGMGQTALARTPDQLTAVLGSCVGLVLYHPRLQIGAMCHVVLPKSNDQPAAPGKFADTAIPHMLDLLKKNGANGAGVVAKFAGGACMFGSGGPMQIGDANVQAIERELKARNIRVVAADVGGKCGRRVAFDSVTGQLTIDSVGVPTQII